MSCAKTRTFVMTYTFVWSSVSKKIIDQGFNAICRIQKIPAIHRKFSAMLTSVLWQNQQLLWNCSDWTLPSAFWKIRPCLWGQWPLRLLLWYFRPDAWRRRNQSIWKTRFHFCEANRDIWTNIRVHQRHRHHILLCNQSNRQPIW